MQQDNQESRQPIQPKKIGWYKQLEMANFLAKMRRNLQFYKIQEKLEKQFKDFIVQRVFYLQNTELSLDQINQIIQAMAARSLKLLDQYNEIFKGDFSGRMMLLLRFYDEYEGRALAVITKKLNVTEKLIRSQIQEKRLQVEHADKNSKYFEQNQQESEKYKLIKASKELQLRQLEEQFRKIFGA